MDVFNLNKQKNNGSASLLIRSIRVTWTNRYLYTKRGKIMKPSNIKTIAGRILFFLAVCFIFIMPILSLLRMSLTTDGGFGLQNYVDMLHEERTAKAIRNTLIISVS